MTNWQFLLNFTASITQCLLVGRTASQVGCFSNGFYGTDRFYFKTYNNTSQVVNAILSQSNNADWSDEYNGITQMHSTSFQTQNSELLDVQNVDVIVSGLTYNYSSSPISAAQTAQSQNIKIVSVSADSALLSDVISISSSPRTQNVTYWFIPTLTSCILT